MRKVVVTNFIAAIDLAWTRSDIVVAYQLVPNQHHLIG